MVRRIAERMRERFWALLSASEYTAYRSNPSIPDSDSVNEVANSTAINTIVKITPRFKSMNLPLNI